MDADNKLHLNEIGQAQIDLLTAFSACNITLTTIWQLLLLTCKTSQTSHPTMSADSTLQLLTPHSCTFYLK